MKAMLRAPQLERLSSSQNVLSAFIVPDNSSSVSAEGSA